MRHYAAFVTVLLLALGWMLWQARHRMSRRQRVESAADLHELEGQLRRPSALRGSADGDPVDDD